MSKISLLSKISCFVHLWKRRLPSMCLSWSKTFSAKTYWSANDWIHVYWWSTLNAWKSLRFYSSDEERNSNLTGNPLFFAQTRSRYKDYASKAEADPWLSVKIVNFIRGWAQNHRLFRSFCDELGSDHSVLLYHTEVRLLSRGVVLNRFFSPREEIKSFLRCRKSDLVILLESPEFIQMLAYIWYFSSTQPIEYLYSRSRNSYCEGLWKTKIFQAELTCLEP